MTLCLSAAARRLSAVVFALLVTLPLAAKDIWDSPPFSADPKQMLAAASAFDPRSANVVYILNEATCRFDQDGHTKTTRHLIKRVVTEEGASQVGTISAYWAPWYEEKPQIEARVISADGAVHQLDPKAIVEATQEAENDIFTDQRVVRAPLPGVATGSLVETFVTTEGRSPIAGGGKYGRFDFGYSVAIERGRLILDAPAGMIPQIVNHSGTDPRVVEENGRRITIFEKEHSERFDEVDGSVPPDDSAYPYVAFATGSSWGDIAKNYSAIVDQQIAASDVKELVATTIGKTTGRDAVIEKLLDLIRKSVRYAGVEVGAGSFVPRPPLAVVQNKYGDCKDKATLLVAMLRSAGIPAHVALLDAGFRFDTVPSLPAVDSFNHAIVVVDGSTDGSPALWIDPTDEYSRAGEIPAEDQGRMALIASAATTALTKTPEIPPSANRYVETRTFKMPEEGTAEVTETTTGSSRQDAYLRRDYASSDKKKFRDTYEKWESSFFVAPKVDKFEAGDPYDFTKPFALTVTLAKSRSGVISNGEGDVLIPTRAVVAMVPKAFLDYEAKTAEAQNAKPEKKRTHDFFIERPLTRVWDYRIIPAAGYQARTLPTNEVTKLGTMTLTTEYSQQSDGTVLAKLTFDSGKRRLTPEEFQATRVAVSEFTRKEGIHLRFESTGQAKLAAGDIGGALVEFRKLAALHPKEAQHHIELARALLAGGLGESARAEARRAVAMEPENAKAQAMLATVLENDLIGREHRRGCDLPGAVAALRKAESLDLTDMYVRVRLGELLLYGDDLYQFGHGAHLEEAAAEFRSIIKDFGDEGKGILPRLMLALTYLGKWDEMKELAKSETDTQQRDMFRLIAVTATGGSAAGLRELAAFDTATRRSYGSSLAQTFIQLRRYSDAADFLEAAAKGSDEASKTLPVIQMLRKAQPYEKLDPDSPKGLLVRFLQVSTGGDPKAVRALFAPEVVGKLDDAELSFNTSWAASVGEGFTPAVVIDLAAAGADVSKEGSDAIGYRFRGRAVDVEEPLVIYAVRRNGKLLVAGLNEAPSLIGVEALKLSRDGNLEAARTWLNWARESIAAGGGDDPLVGPPFARLWKKDTASATLEEIQAAAASLMTEKEFAADSIAVLEPQRAKAASDDAKTAIDISLATDYHFLHDWTKLTPVAEGLWKAHPDSDVAFMMYTEGLSAVGKGADAEKLANERLAKHAKDTAAMRALVASMARRHDYDQAAMWMRKLLDDVAPSSADFNNAAWIALFRGKDLDRAIDDAQRATKEGNEGAAASLHTLACVYAETGNTVEARQALMKSIDLRPSSEPRSVDWFVLGRIAEIYGVPDAAAAAYKRVEKEEPDGQTTWELTQRHLASLH